MKSLVWVHVLGALAMALVALTPPASAQLEIYVSFAPPPLPVYDQPEIPGAGFIWAPGYWGWDDYEEDYYWVPGTWVQPPEVGLYWTPGYWGWDSDGDRYGWNEGYWSRSVGYYGGIDYGYGYTGHGYEGGEWRGRDFYYNRSVNNIRVNITTFYNKPVEHNRTIYNYSYNGPGGVTARPAPQQTQVRERVAPTSIQISHEHQAKANLDLRAAHNHGKPPIAATPRPAEFTRGVPAKAAAVYTPPPRKAPQQTAQPERQREQPQQQTAQPERQREQPQQQAQPDRQRAQPQQQQQVQTARQREQPQAQPGRQREQPQQQAQQVRQREQPQQQAQPGRQREQPQQQAQPSRQREQPQQQAQPSRQREQPQQQAQPGRQREQPQQQAQPSRQREQPQQQAQPDRQRAQPQQQGESKQSDRSGKSKKKRPQDRSN